MYSELLLVQWFYNIGVCVGVMVVDADKFKMHDFCSFHDFCIVAV